MKKKQDRAEIRYAGPLFDPDIPEVGPFRDLSKRLDKSKKRAKSPITSRRQVFQQYDEANPKVWQLFVRFTFEAINAGRKHYGAKMVWERMRWYTSIETKDPDFKLCNTWTAWYARKFHAKYPEHGTFFSTRRSEADF